VEIRGFIDFYNNYSHVHEHNDKDGLIVWSNGFVKLSTTDGEIPFNTAIGVKINTEVKLLGTNVPSSLTSSFEFIDHLRKFDALIDVGIWFDHAKNTLFVARNVFGMCPLYYVHIPNKFIAFSTNLVALVQMPLLRDYLRLDYYRILNFSTFRRDPSKDYTEDTFYEGIKAALPGQILSLTTDTKSHSPFIKFDISEWTALKSLSEYGEAFRGLLTDSVANNIKDPSGLLGSHLSGGLDSSSVSSIVKILNPERPLHTFYYSTRGYTNNDNAFARCVAKKIGSIHHEVIQSTDDLNIIQSNTKVYGRPMASIVSPTSEATVNRLASQLKCNLLLNGSDGDSIVGSGFEFMELLYRNKEWITLKKMLSDRVKYFSLSQNYPGWEHLSLDQKTSIVEQNFIYKRLTSEIRRSGLLHSAKSLNEVSKHFDLSLAYFLKRGVTAITAKLKKTSIQPLTALRDDFQEMASKRLSAKQGLSSMMRGELPTEYHQWFEDIFNQHSVSLNEERFALAQSYGFKNASPFYDKRLFELCISIPAIAKFGDGRGRVHFREAMKGILPENVRLRHEKVSLGHFGREVTLRLYHQSEELLMDSADIWKCIDKTKFLKTLKFLKTDGLEVSMYNRSLFHITKTVSLAVWFEWLRSEGIPIDI
jgi:asparagine synthase (glutamine-hydrolysing)